jgi:hypothetical protein
MRFARFALAVLSGVVLAGPAAAQDSGSFVVRLGRDTTGVEHYSSTGKRIEIDQVGRSPRVLTRHLTFDLGPGSTVTHGTITIAPPGAATPLQVNEATVTGDTVFYQSRRDTTVQHSRVAMPGGGIVMSYSSPWSLYERQMMRLVEQKGADSLRAPMYAFGATDLNWVTVRRLGRDSMSIQTSGDLYHARVDRKGRLLNLVPIVGTQRFSVDRVEKLDLAAMTAGFAATEKAAGAMGTLSPRDSVKTTVAGASLWIDYGRPAKRGRVVFGGVVPWGDVWRTGANAATQFRTDKALVIGGVTVPAGFYTLWTVPSPTGWKLIVNGETGQWGTEHKADRDLYTIPMTVSALSETVEKFVITITPGDTGGTLNMDWDTTRASVAFTVQP